MFAEHCYSVVNVRCPVIYYGIGGLSALKAHESEFVFMRLFGHTIRRKKNTRHPETIPLFPEFAKSLVYQPYRGILYKIIDVIIVKVYIHSECDRPA